MRPWSWRPRLLPLVIAGIGLLLAVKLGASSLALVAALSPSRVELIGAAQAEATPSPAAPPRPAPPAPRPAAAPPAALPPAQATAAEPACEVPRTDAAERALLEQLRARRGEIDRREQAVAEREVVLAASERRLAERVESLAALQARIEAADQARSERDEQGWRQMVKLYEGMRPREAAAILDELEMPVLVQIMTRMGERKAAPLLGAMRPDRARQLTAELARNRVAAPIN